MSTKVEREAAALKAAQEAEAADAGATFFKAYPEALMVEAWWEAGRRYGLERSFHQCWAFYHAFQNARLQRDEYLKERAKP